MINQISIKNFKCFKNLSIEGLHQVNLFAGKNNIGKTAFLEAVELASTVSNPKELAIKARKIVKRRQQSIKEDNELEFNFFYKDSSKLEIVTEQNTAQIYFDDKGIVFDLNCENMIIQSVEYDFKQIFSLQHGKKAKMFAAHQHFIGSGYSTEAEIAELYGALVDLDKEDFLNQALQAFDNTVLALKQVFMNKRISLKLRVKGEERAVLLSSFGEGINRYIAIICAIWANKDGYLFIDEIENGIHFGHYNRLWSIIFKTSKDANCQLFIATHSKECIEAFNAKNKDEWGAYFEFYRHIKKNEIVATYIDKAQLNYELSHQGKIRGE